MSQSSWSTEAEDQEIPTGERNTNTVCKCIQSKTHTHTPTHTHTQTHTLTYASTSSIIRTHTLTYASASSLTHPHTHTHLCKCRHTLEQNTNIHLPGQYLYVRSSLSHTHTHMATNYSNVYAKCLFSSVPCLPRQSVSHAESHSSAGTPLCAATTLIVQSVSESLIGWLMVSIPQCFWLDDW